MSNVSKDERLYSAVHEYLLQADERIVFRALPAQIADDLGFEPRPTLEALVDAMFGGEAILHWEIVCPTCGGWGERHDWLRHAQHEAYCQRCEAPFTVHMDQESQATFSPHPTLRAIGPDADDRDYQRDLRQRYPPTTVHELLMIQSFRDWAREQPLPGDEHLEVGRMVIWFSDLAGSTALYEKIGDPHGFHLVRDHFNVIFDAIHGAKGAVVKTTGDGVMAVFLSGRHALDAALAAHRALEDFNRDQTLPADERLYLKVGIHAGPAIAVTLNERLDYFGSSVNLASRLDGLAQGGEIVLTDAVFADLDLQEIVSPYQVEAFQTTVRGLSQTLTAYRLRCK
jgi:class 3 adenylate cyclase